MNNIFQSIKLIKEILDKKNYNLFLFLIPIISISSILEMIGIGIIPIFVSMYINFENLNQISYFQFITDLQIYENKTNFLYLGIFIIILFFLLK